ncbi:MAG: hypothetical protein ACJ74J_12290 [Blastocatellia bacterium]
MKATLSLGALALHRKDYDSALYFYQETIKAGKLNDASLQALKAIGVIKAIDGDHRQAVKNLEGILPVTKYAPAHIYFDILNSYAVELGEVGRKDEARHIMRYVLASPFAFAYPEWRETAEDLKSARRSSVMFAATPYNVSALPKREPDNPAATPPSRARVLNFAKLKQKMAKKAEEKQAALVLENMSLQDMWFKLIELVTDDQLDAAQMRALLKFVVNLFSTQVQPPNHPSA